MGPNTQLGLIWDRFVAGHENCALRRGISIVFHRRLPSRALLTVDKPACMPADRVVAAVAAPPVGPGDLEALLRHLLPTAPVPTPPTRPIPTNIKLLLERLLSGAQAPTPTPTPQTGTTGMETLLQCLLPGTPVPALQSQPVPARRLDYDDVFSGGKPGHGVGRCLELDETFPYMLPRWSAEKVGANYVMISPRIAAECLRAGKGT